MKARQRVRNPFVLVSLISKRTKQLLLNGADNDLSTASLVSYALEETEEIIDSLIDGPTVYRHQ
jgi:hypothetical protein